MSTTSIETAHQAATFVELLRWRSQRHADRRCAYFLENGEIEKDALTYRDLDVRARALASTLSRRGATGENALLLYSPGLDFISAFFGCLYGGVVAVPTYPPHPARIEKTLPKLLSITRDSQPTVVLTTRELLGQLDPLFEMAPEMKRMEWIATDEIAESAADDWEEPLIHEDSLAFLQYTSGSTAAPKGVMVSHGNLLHNSSLIHERFETNEESKGVFWLPFYHDMGLVGGILQTLFCGAEATLMSPLAFLQSPMRWLKAISDSRATISGGPNFSYDLCVRRAAPEDIESLDLSSWELAFNGAEPIRTETLERFAGTFQTCGFRKRAFFPCYGLAESTLLVSGGKRTALPVIRTYEDSSLAEGRAVRTESGQGRTLIGCGQIPSDQRVVVVQPETQQSCLEGEIGEIWVTGSSVAKGYWNRVDESATTFQAYVKDTGEGPFLRTGDLGFFDGTELFVVGRLKDLIIIDGRNLYPQDIEHTVEKSHAQLRPNGCAAFSVDQQGREYLVVVAELEPGLLRELRNDDGTGARERKIEELSRSIRQCVSDVHDAQVYDVLLLKPGKLPKTASGKIQRHACRVGYLAGTLDRIPE